MYPQLAPSEREVAYVREHGTTFIMKIGDVLRSGQKHDGRAPDYDDWSLNGDIIFWNDVLQENHMDLTDILLKAEIPAEQCLKL